MSAVLLLQPKYPHNVGNALRACALLGVSELYWTGDRVAPPNRWPEGARLPREERLRCYERTKLIHLDSSRPITAAVTPRYGSGFQPLTPVCVEIVDGAEDLRAFIHPPFALYIFGPEDDSIERLKTAGYWPKFDPGG